MTAISKTIENAEATDPQAGLMLIPLNKLAISERNIRRTDRKADLDALAASIKSLVFCRTSRSPAPQLSLHSVWRLRCA